MAWSKIVKPTSSFTKTGKPYPLDNFLFQDGNNFLFQDANYFVYEKSLTPAFTKTAKPA